MVEQKISPAVIIIPAVGLGLAGVLGLVAVALAKPAPPGAKLTAIARYLGATGLEAAEFLRGDIVTCEITVINEGSVAAKNVWVYIITTDGAFAGEEKSVFPIIYDIAPGASQVFTNSQVIPADAPLGTVIASGGIRADNAPDVEIPSHTAYTIVEIVAILRGQVRDAVTLVPLSGVKVTLEAEIAQTYTDAYGYYRFDGLEPVKLMVFFEKEGYETEWRWPTLAPGDNELNVFLTPATTILSYTGPRYG